MSYGEVARFAGYPRHSRMVSKAMSRSPDALPWYRVVRADLSIAFPKDSSAYQKQLKLLKEPLIKSNYFMLVKTARNFPEDRSTPRVLPQSQAPSQRNRVTITAHFEEVTNSFSCA